MKCELLYNHTVIMLLDLELEINHCTVTGYKIVNTIPEQLSFLNDYSSKMYGVLSVFLSTRISKQIQNMSKNEILHILNLYQERDNFDDIKQFLFLVSLLWHLEIGDGISLYPIQAEYLYLGDIDARFTHVYRLSNSPQSIKNEMIL